MSLKSPRFASNERLQSAASNDPVLARGAISAAVRVIQQALIDLRFPLPISTKKFGSPDGVFGAETKSRVRDFQRKSGLSPDGIVGKNTMHKLDELLPGAAAPLPPLPKGTLFTHRVRVHLRTVARPSVSEYTSFHTAQRVYAQYKIKLQLSSAASLMLPKGKKLDLEVIDVDCYPHKLSADQRLIYSLGNSGNIGANDIRVYYVDRIRDVDLGTLHGCAGSLPGKAAVTVAAAASRWDMAHEIGHILLGSSYKPVHHADTRNLMHASSVPATTPFLDDSQVQAIKRSRYCVAM